MDPEEVTILLLGLGAVVIVGMVAAVDARIRARRTQASTEMLVERSRAANDPWTRQAAARALGEMHDPRAVPALLDALRDSIPDVRWAAALSLGRRRDRSALMPLLHALADPWPGVRQAAAWALGELGDERAVEPLMAAARSQHASVRWRSVEALARLGCPVHDPLIEALGDPKLRVRQAAGAALRKLGEAGVVSAVEQALAGRVGATDDPRMVAPLIRALEGPRDLRRAAEEALLRLPDQGAAALAAALPLASPRTRDALSRILVCMGHAAVGPLSRLLHGGGRDARRSAARLLGEVGDPEGVTALIRALDDLDPDVRRLAAESLGRIGTAAAAALPALRAIDKDDNLWWVFTEAASSIERALAKALRESPHELIAADSAGTGTEPEAASAPPGRGTEPEAVDVPPSQAGCWGELADPGATVVSRGSPCR